MPARFDKTAVHISNQSLIAFLERFAMPAERFLNWTGEQAIAVGFAIRAFNWAFGVAVIALLWRRARRGPRVEAVDSAAAVMALAAVIAPLGWGHTFVLVLPLVILHLVSLRDARPLQVVIVGCCVAAMMIPAGRRFWFIEQMAGVGAECGVLEILAGDAGADRVAAGRSLRYELTPGDNRS